MELVYQGRKFPCVVQRKQMKNLRVRVMEDGTIRVSAPHRVSDARILSFLQEHAAELASLVDKAKATRAAALDYADGSSIPWLGGSITLRWLDAPRPTMLENGVLSVFARSQKDAQIAVRQWMIGECVKHCRECNRQTYEAFRKKGYAVPLAHIQIKEMTSRWGSCTAQTGRISMNFRLMQYPPECLYGVFCHEYAHFLHQDHSEGFYAVLLDVCPEYRKWDALLKKK